MKLEKDSVFIYPTDTVWGIGGSIYSHHAYTEIAKIKRTTEDKPLSIMFTDINILCESFNFPKEMTLQWLEKFFQLESTLGIPLVSSKIKIPSWVTSVSDIVSVRFSTDEVLMKIGEELQSPFFTTSLNLTGTPPIINFKSAQDFQKEHAPQAAFFGNAEHDLSGCSSTIVFLKDGAFKIIREGQKMKEIKKHLGLTGFSIS